MKYLIKILIALLSLTIIVGVTSCDKDDGSGNTASSEPEPRNSPKSCASCCG